MADEIYVAYARERLKWLYEIYHMGGMTLEEFRSKVQEKMSEEDAGGAGAPPAPASNAALANLNKELGKKFKK